MKLENINIIDCEKLSFLKNKKGTQTKKKLGTTGFFSPPFLFSPTTEVVWCYFNMYLFEGAVGKKSMRDGFDIFQSWVTR